MNLNNLPYLDIYCDKKNWEKSRIEAHNVPSGDRYLLPQSCTATELQEPLKSIWDAMQAAFQSLDPNGWAAEFIHAFRGTAVVTPATETEPAVTAPCVVCEIHRVWDNNTYHPDAFIEMRQESEALILFDALVSATFWEELATRRAEQQAAAKAAYEQKLKEQEEQLRKPTNTPII